MNVEQMRMELRLYYGPGSPFAERLKSMKDSQIKAIYFRLKEKGVFK